MVLKFILVWLGLTYLVWMPAVIWYKVKDKPHLRSSAALHLAGNLVLTITYGAWFLFDLPIVIPIVGIGLFLSLRLVGRKMLRRFARYETSESEESSGDALEL